jgi:hypothetical protein
VATGVTIACRVGAEPRERDDDDLASGFGAAQAATVALGWARGSTDGGDGHRGRGRAFTLAGFRIGLCAGRVRGAGRQSPTVRASAPSGEDARAVAPREESGRGRLGSLPRKSDHPVGRHMIG